MLPRVRVSTCIHVCTHVYARARCYARACVHACAAYARVRTYARLQPDRAVRSRREEEKGRSARFICPNFDGRRRARAASEECISHSGSFAEYVLRWIPSRRFLSSARSLLFRRRAPSRHVTSSTSVSFEELCQRQRIFTIYS